MFCPLEVNLEQVLLGETLVATEDEGDRKDIQAQLLHTTDLCTVVVFIETFILTSVIRHISKGCVYAENQISTRNRSLA